ncbi:MAG: Gar1/Naf1 family protein [Methanoregulaceae archaeon]
MNVVGRAMSTPGRRMLIIQCDAAQLPGLYSEVTDHKMRPVGKIVDIFGNIKAPYATVICRERCDIKPNEKLYAKSTTETKGYYPVHRKRM